MKSAKSLAALGAVAVIAFGCVLFFGSALERTASSAAACMESANNLRECSRVDSTEFWEPLAAMAILGFFVGAVCFINGHSERVKQH